MNVKFFLYVMVITVFLGACSTGAFVTNTKQSAEAAYNSGNYENALSLWEEIIDLKEKKGKKAEAKVYCKAGKSALKLGKHEKAIAYLNEARYAKYAEPEMYEALAKVYRNIDNLSKEIMALEDYVNKFPEGKEIIKIRKRLFMTYVISENWDLAFELWSDIDEESKSNVEIIEGYLIVNRELENDEICDDLADRLLKENANNIVALEWNAKKYFYKAENRYQKEMDAYNNHKTRSQYAKLLKALDIVNADFKISLKYFMKLYKIDDKNEYAKYLGNIYARFNDKKKVDYYRSKIK